MDGIGMTKVVNTWDTSLRRADISPTKEVAEASTETRTRIGSRRVSAPSIHEKRGGGDMRKAPACSQVQLHFASGVFGERHEARLVELRGTHSECALRRVIVGQDEANELAAA